MAQLSFSQIVVETGFQAFAESVVQEYGAGESGVGKFLGENGLGTLGEDFSVCRCKIHRKGDPPDGAQSGCAKSTKVPTVGPVKAAFEEVHHFCDAHPDTRGADYRHLVSCVRAVFAVGEGKAVATMSQVSSSAANFTAQAFGPGYCYLEPFVGQARYRLARIMGPYPKVKAFVAMLLVGVRANAGGMVMEEVAAGRWHLRKVKGAAAAGQAGQQLLKQAVGICMANPGARLGAEAEGWSSGADSDADVVVYKKGIKPLSMIKRPSGITFGDYGGVAPYGLPPVPGGTGFMATHVKIEPVKQLVAAIAAAGVKVPKPMITALALARHTPSLVPAEFIDGPERLGVFSMLGDAMMRSVVASFALVLGESKRVASSMIADSQSNISLVNAVKKHGWDKFMNVGAIAAGSKTYADVFEAIMGVIFMYRGPSDGARVMAKLDLVPDMDEWKSVYEYESVRLPTGPAGSRRHVRFDNAERNAGAPASAAGSSVASSNVTGEVTPELMDAFVATFKKCFIEKR